MESRTRINLSLTPDTAERLRQYAYENHYSCVSQAVTQWIWSQKISGGQIRGQISLNQLGVTSGRKKRRTSHRP